MLSDSDGYRWVEIDPKLLSPVYMPTRKPETIAFATKSVATKIHHQLDEEMWRQFENEFEDIEDGDRYLIEFIQEYDYKLWYILVRESDHWIRTIVATGRNDTNPMITKNVIGYFDYRVKSQTPLPNKLS